jgi:hypothetical protein
MLAVRQRAQSKLCKVLRADLISAEKGKIAVLLGAGLLDRETFCCLEQPLGCERKIAVNSTLVHGVVHG